MQSVLQARNLILNALTTGNNHGTIFRILCFLSLILFLPPSPLFNTMQVMYIIQFSLNNSPSLFVFLVSSVSYKKTFIMITIAISYTIN